nr:hypothetical protein GCM10025732_01920 [Glycomyces mayteni]
MAPQVREGQGRGGKVRVDPGLAEGERGAVAVAFEGFGGAGLEPGVGEEGVGQARFHGTMV